MDWIAFAGWGSAATLGGVGFWLRTVILDQRNTITRLQARVETFEQTSVIPAQQHSPYSEPKEVGSNTLNKLIEETERMLLSNHIDIAHLSLDGEYPPFLKPIIFRLFYLRGERKALEVTANPTLRMQILGPMITDWIIQQAPQPPKAIPAEIVDQYSQQVSELERQHRELEHAWVRLKKSLVSAEEDILERLSSPQPGMALEQFFERLHSSLSDVANLIEGNATQDWPVTEEAIQSNSHHLPKHPLSQVQKIVDAWSLRCHKLAMRLKAGEKEIADKEYLALVELARQCRISVKSLQETAKVPGAEATGTDNAGAATGKAADPGDAPVLTDKVAASAQSATQSKTQAEAKAEPEQAES